ncbi:SCO family protein [Pseudoalteromonas 'SMAR']|uniref:SCO family protein n=1 Tax=Pseudoalteromonas 'SMAR' TaxID=3416908 RepID=UPI003AF22EDA
MKRFLIFLLVGAIAACAPPPDVSEKVVWYEQPKALQSFELNDQHGNTITNTALQGSWTLLFLGYTSCPDICPMTLLKLAHTYQVLESNEDVDVWFVSVDPNRDTQQKRAAYIKHFNPEFKAVSAEHAQLFPFVKDLGLIYAINQQSDQDYYVDHSASVALVNPQGQLEAIFKPTYAPGSVPTIDEKQLLTDLQHIIN